MRRECEKYLQYCMYVEDDDGGDKNGDSLSCFCCCSCSYFVFLVSSFCYYAGCLFVPLFCFSFRFALALFFPFSPFLTLTGAREVVRR